MIVPCQRSRAHVGLLAIALAVAMPGSAAAQDAEAGPASGAPSATRAPLTEFDDFGVEWPDMSEIGDGATGAAAGRVAIDAEQRYEVVLRGLDEIEGEGDLRSQFNALSRLHQGEGRRAVVAQIDRRADADRELMRQLLRSRGYYDARVVVDLGGETGEGRVEVVFEIEPGPLYRFGSVELPGLDAAGARTEELRGQFPVDEEDPVDAAAVGAAQLNLRSELGNRGYPFAEVGEEEVTVDHANRIATLRQPVEIGRAHV